MRREGSDDMSSNFQVMFLLKEQFIPKHLLQVPPGSENMKKKKKNCAETPLGGVGMRKHCTTCSSPRSPVPLSMFDN